MFNQKNTYSSGFVGGDKISNINNIRYLRYNDKTGTGVFDFKQNLCCSIKMIFICINKKQKDACILLLK